MKGIASDFDGTLYFGDIEGGCKKEDLMRIKEFQDKGHYFGICTGRPLVGIEDNLKGKVDLDFYILTTGALILDKDKKIIFEQLIDEETMLSIYNMYKDITNIFIQGEDTVYAFKEEDVNLKQTVIKDIKDVKGKIYGFSLNTYSEENAERICKEIKYYYHDLDAFQNKKYIDIVKKGCSKGHAVRKVKELLNLDVIAGIGDNYNDISMLESADVSFTFHDSPDAVKKVSDHIVHHLYESIDKL